MLPRGINIHGAIIGHSNQRGFVRAPDGAITIITAPLFGANLETGPLAINAAGQIVGVALSLNPRAFFRDVDGTTTILLPNGAAGAVATAINEVGEITGAEFDSADFAHGFVTGPNGTVTFVGPLNAQDVWGLGINRAGTVIGVANTIILPPPFPPVLSFKTQGFIQTATSAPVVFPMQTVYQGGKPYLPYVNGGINAKGAAVIQNLYVYVLPDGTISITPIELGPCGDVSAQAINDSGWVTGSCTVPGQPSSGFLWVK